MGERHSDLVFNITLHEHEQRALLNCECDNPTVHQSNFAIHGN